MASTFVAVNSDAGPAIAVIDTEKSTSQPTASHVESSSSQHMAVDPPGPLAESLTTPTQATFGISGMASQRPLPNALPASPMHVADPVEGKSSPRREAPRRGNSQSSEKSKDSEDVDMDGSDGEEANEDNAAGSDNESVAGAGSKKKKSQKFYCTDYPPCHLSFTRSEHLARHIRKHTGERPFKCHCGRMFSRLDNLRQHAQTVHQNEEIPMDSLAATSTRYQRQVRTDRVRQPARPRAGTAGSATGTPRGHSKSLSTSSITSLAAAYSPAELRRRPAPLIMADPRARHSVESYHSGYELGHPNVRNVSPDFSTPTSTAYSTGHSSPRWGSGVASPTTSLAHSRTQSLFASSSRTHARRLSGPTGSNPFQHPPHANGGSVHLQAPFETSHSALLSPSGSSFIGSPTTPSFSRRDSLSSASEEAWRRRTWHPESSNFTGGVPGTLFGFRNEAVPQIVAPLPLADPKAQNSSVRLPGIDALDRVMASGRPPTPPLRNPSPMIVDSDQQRPTHHRAYSDIPEEALPNNLHRVMNRLDIDSRSASPRDSASHWANEASQAVMAQGEKTRLNPPTVRFDNEVTVTQYPAQTPRRSPLMGTQYTSRPMHHHTVSAPLRSQREGRRHGWYQGPPTIHQPLGRLDEAPRSHLDRMEHPNLGGFSLFPRRSPQPDLELPRVAEEQTLTPPQSSSAQQTTFPQQPGFSSAAERTDALDALVAIATSEAHKTTSVH